MNEMQLLRWISEPLAFIAIRLRGWDPQLNSNNPVETGAVDIDHDTHQELAVSFTDLELYMWDETTS